MKTTGAFLIVLGFALWFGGELLAIQPYNVRGLPMVLVGAALYFLGRRGSCPGRGGSRLSEFLCLPPLGLDDVLSVVVQNFT